MSISDKTLELIINKYICVYKNTKYSSPSDSTGSQNNSCQINLITFLPELPWKKPTQIKHHLFIQRQTYIKQTLCQVYTLWLSNPHQNPMSEILPFHG